MTGPAREVAAVRSAVTAAVADLPPGALALVACSGGPDSLALAAGTAFVAQKAGTPWRAQAVVVDHGLQEGSAQVADDAAAACRGLGLPAVVVRVAVDGRGEAAARDARYAALDRVADELDAAAVLLGHTLDDQAETVLLGLARGSGARALAGMPATRGRFRRPLLGLRRSDTLADDLLAAARTADGLDIEVLREAPPALRTRALRSAAIAAGSPAGALGRAHVLAVDALVTDWHGQGPVALPGGIVAGRACGRLALGTAPA